MDVEILSIPSGPSEPIPSPSEHAGPIPLDTVHRLEKNEKKIRKTDKGEECS